jgi:predicted MFS family arabinose efflux permease
MLDPEYGASRPNNESRAEQPDISPFLIGVLAAACGLIVASMYYAQPLLGMIGPDLGFAPWAAGLIVTTTQLGYVAGLLLLVPLGDLVENRRLVLVTLWCNICALLLAAFAPNGAFFLIASLAVGITASALQMLVPIATHLARPETRGRVVGFVMSGLLLGVLLARPLSSLVAGSFGWRIPFFGSAAAIAIMCLILARALPVRHPRAVESYVALIRSLGATFLSYRVLQRRAAYQALLFASFSLFWTAVPLYLAEHYGLSQHGIALFALAGAGGVVAAPVAGRLADLGWVQQGTLLSMLLVLAAFLLCAFDLPLWLLALMAILLDAGIQGNLITSQRIIYALDPAQRSRINSVFMATFFIGGAAGSSVATALVASHWHWVIFVGAVLPALALLLFAGEYLPKRR